jgi:hypothetical protein
VIGSNDPPKESQLVQNVDNLRISIYRHKRRKQTMTSNLGILGAVIIH